MQGVCKKTAQYIVPFGVMCEVGSSTMAGSKHLGLVSHLDIARESPKSVIRLPIGQNFADPKPEPDARIKWHQQIFIRRAARFKAMYGN
jgi:hypothetical protein